jgi:hypothetical protein
VKTDGRKEGKRTDTTKLIMTDRRKEGKRDIHDETNSDGQTEGGKEGQT